MSKSKKRQLAAERRVARTELLKEHPEAITYQKMLELTSRAKQSGINPARLYKAWEVQHMIEQAVVKTNQRWFDIVQESAQKSRESLKAEMDKTYNDRMQSEISTTSR